MSNLQSNRFALEWARCNLPPQQYYEIHKSYYATRRRTLIFVLCNIPIMVAFLLLIFCAPFSKKAEADAAPSGATTCKTARIDYDGNFYWTHDSQKYEEALDDFGLNPDSFQPGDTVTIYIDDYQNVLKVTEAKEGLDIRDMEILVGSIGAIVVPIILILCIYIPIAFTTFGKPWRTFIRAYNNGWGYQRM